jgi:hypothetical protein
LENCLEKYKAAGKIKRSVGPRGNLFGEGREKVFPRGVPVGIVIKGMPRYLDGRELLLKPRRPEI